MTPTLVLLSLAMLLVLLVHGRLSPAILFVTWAVGYHFVGLVDQSTLLASYTNPALATLVVLLLISLALERTPLVQGLSNRLLHGRPRWAVLRLTGTVALLSAFLNNTAVVGALLGPLSRQTHIAPSRVLLPLSYAAILGGVTTLVGTSTNLVVNSFMVSAGLPPMGLFDLAWVGVPAALACLGVMALTYHRLPANTSPNAMATQRYFLEAAVAADSPLVGRSIEANQLRHLEGLFLLEIDRQGRLLSPVSPQEVLQAGDRLVFTGEVEKVSSLQRFAGLQLFGHRADDLLRANLVEVVLVPDSELAQKTLRDVDFRTMFDAGVVGIRRGDQELKGQLGRIRLFAGDALLLAVGSNFAQHRNLDRNFVIVNGAPVRPSLSHRQSTAVVGGFAAVLALSAFNWVPLLSGLLALLGALLASRVLSVSELRRRFPFELVLIIGSALVIARVLQSSGAATLVSGAIQTLFSGYGPLGALVGVYLVTLVLTEVVTNNAAAALGFPIGLSAANAFGIDPMPFVLAVCYGASAGFLVPFGYQTHLMVYTPGRYRLQDFVRFGLPVSITYSVVVIALLAFSYPFAPR